MVRGLRARGRDDGRVAPVRRQVVLERVDDERERDLAVGFRVLLQTTQIECVPMMMAPSATANETVLVTGALRPGETQNHDGLRARTMCERE